NSLGSTLYTDVQATWNTPWNGRITAGINNLFDEDPPVSYSTFINNFDPAYDIPGRFWYLRYAQQF
nr:TonB-dependent receptor [Xanthomonadales bacterium]